MYFKIYIIVLLIVGSVFDWKYLRVPRWLLGLVLAGGLGAVAVKMYVGNEYWGSVLGAMVPGIILLFLARLSEEQIGWGDGLVLLGMGGCMEYIEVICSFWAALVMMFLISVVLVIFKGVRCNIKLPFVPFLALSSIFVLGGEWLLG